jgi:lipoate---protein ligase
MLGEYKTPGGKLVRVEFEIEGGTLRNVEVSGDFFLYPEDSLFPITRSLEGAPASLSASGLEQRIAAAIPGGTEWLGSSPAALSIAVERALSGEES